MSRLSGLAFIIAGTLFFINSDRFAQQSIDRSARQRRDDQWRSPQWLTFTLWQGRLLSAILILVGLLALLGVVSFD